MRTSILVLLAASLLAPGLAGAEPYYRECRRITKQITHFEDVVSLARERDDALWESATKQHIERLTERRHELCPERYPKVNVAARAAKRTKELMKLAADLAIKYFTFGAF
jgi:hypothetical protein